MAEGVNDNKSMFKADIALQFSRAFMAKHKLPYLTRGAIAAWGAVVDGKPLSNEAIRQIEERALRKLRRYGVFKRADLNFHCALAARHYRVEM